MDTVALLFIVGLAIAAELGAGRGDLARPGDGTAGGRDRRQRTPTTWSGRSGPRSSRPRTPAGSAEQTAHDTTYLTELLTGGVVRLRDDLTVDFANGAAHVMLDRKPGTMVGRSALEAFVDTRIEGVARRPWSTARPTARSR